MSTKVPLAFVVLAVVLAAVVLGLQKFNVGQPNATPTPTSQVTVFTFDDGSVTNSTVMATGKSVSFQKDSSGNWTISDSGLPADRVTLSSLIVQMSTLTATQDVASPTDLSQYGLDSPSQSITVQLSDGSSYELDLGTSSPIGSGTYARKNGAPDVYLISSQIGTSIARLVQSPQAPPTPTPYPTATPTVAAPGTPGASGTPTP